MQLTFLGTGDFLPDRSGHNSAFIEWNNTYLFIDFPATNRQSLKKLGFDLNIVEHLFITHLHEDHINGLQQLAHYKTILGKGKTNLYIAEDLVEGLWNTLKEGLGLSTNGPKKLEDYFHVTLVRPEEEFYIAGQSFRIIRTDHIPQMISYGLLAEPYFYYSGDSIVNEALLHSLNVHTIFHDCHMWDLPILSHPSLQEIKALDSSLTKKMILMHYHSGYDTEEAKLRIERKEKIRLARPLYSYKFSS